MITLISPAKSMNFETQLNNIKASEATFKDKTKELLSICKNLSKNDISKIMGVSAKIAELNYERFQDFDNLPSKQAIFAYNGDVYNNIDTSSFSSDNLDFAQQHLLIISGLYGLLHPLDLIKPYRLEMGIKLDNITEKRLSKFWQAIISNKLNQIISTHSNKFIINLASNEYSDAIDKNITQAKIINIHFREIRNNQVKNIPINSKRARGMFADYIIRNQIDSLLALPEFDYSGYLYNAEMSDSNNLVFIK